MATELTPRFRQAEADLVGAETPEARLAAIQKMREELEHMAMDEQRAYWHAKIHPMIRLAQEAFQRELPELIKKHKGWWAAYHGDKRLEIAKDDRILYKKFSGNIIPEDELLVELIEHRPSEYWIF
jgi:N-methylhydantoinase B/oxoprolinase/acetone carboxylase alpha subunit